MDAVKARLQLTALMASVVAARNLVAIFSLPPLLGCSPSTPKPSPPYLVRNSALSSRGGHPRLKTWESFGGPLQRHTCETSRSKTRAICRFDIFRCVAAIKIVSSSSVSFIAL